MKFNSLLAVIATACSTQLVHALDWGTICPEPNFGGTCTTYQSSAINKCVNFTGKDSFWNDKISSLSVINNFGGGIRVRCTFFANEQCSGQSITFVEGRYNTIQALDNQFTSFNCFTI